MIFYFKFTIYVRYFMLQRRCYVYLKMYAYPHPPAAPSPRIAPAVVGDPLASRIAAAGAEVARDGRHGIRGGCEHSNSRIAVRMLATALGVYKGAKTGPLVCRIAAPGTEAARDALVGYEGAKTDPLVS